MARILISGSVAYDRIMDFDGFFRDHFLPDKLHNINVSFSVASPAQEFGGTAGNIAYTLALLEERASIIATVGSDFAEYRKHLDARGIAAPSCVSDMLTLPDYFRRMKVPHFYDPGQQITVLDGDQLKTGIDGAA